MIVAVPTVGHGAWAALSPPIAAGPKWKALTGACRGVAQPAVVADVGLGGALDALQAVNRVTVREHVDYT